MVLRERGVRGSGEGSEEEERRIHWSAREYLVWGGGGGGGGEESGKRGRGRVGGLEGSRF